MISKGALRSFKSLGHFLDLRGDSNTLMANVSVINQTQVAHGLLAWNTVELHLFRVRSTHAFLVHLDFFLEVNIAGVLLFSDALATCWT